MKVLFINSVCGVGSTGRICTTLAQEYENQGHEVKIAYGRAENVPEQYKKYAVRIGKNIDMKLHAVRTRILDEHGLGSIQATRKFLKWADDYNPDLLWLHNIHGYYINYELLFAWIKRHPSMQVKWTLHDCWAFTGHCTHFSFVGCEQWKTNCERCIQSQRYPASYGKDNCKKNFDRKRASFAGVKNLTLITPSKWLADLTRQSFLREYPVEVRYNTIDTNVFKPTPSDFRERYGLQDKFIILGVANVWHERKGFNDFLKLADMLDARYIIVLVGLSKKQIKTLPPRILGIERTNNPQGLAEIYTAADIFFNPTHEDNYPTVNLEAEACGTNIITYNVGGCVETIEAGKGEAIDESDLNYFYKLLKTIIQRRENICDA